jgi:chromosome segregation ATPase
MSQSAHVASIQILVDFQAALCTFSAEAREILSCAQMAVTRTQDWLEHQAHLWQAEVRRCEDAVSAARTELARRKMIRIGDRAPDCTEQEKALRRALQRLDEAETKLATTRRWLPQLRRDIEEYTGATHQLSGFLEGEHPRALALLQMKIDALEAYVHLAGSVTKEQVPSMRLAPDSGQQSAISGQRSEVSAEESGVNSEEPAVSKEPSADH